MRVLHHLFLIGLVFRLQRFADDARSFEWEKITPADDGRLFYQQKVWKKLIIMAGGIGSRFWPKSRQSKPKQFLDILGTGKSFIRMTYERFEKLAPAENFLVVTNARYKDLVLEQIPELGPEQVLCEPVGRNTAPCICYAAYGLQKRDPGAKMIVTPADHLILNEEDFRAIIGECLDFIDDRAALMTVGIKPTRPETGYGYIQVSDDRTISKVKCFTEKPNLELAQTFLQCGEFLWNSGIFVWKVGDIIEAVRTYQIGRASCRERVSSPV